MIADFIKSINKDIFDLKKIEETIVSLHIICEFKKYEWSYIESFFKELSTISHRDKFAFNLDIKGNIEKIENTSPDMLKKLKNHFNEDKEDSYEIELILTKKTEENKISVYFIDELAKYFNKEKINNLLSTIDKNKSKDYLIFEVFANFKSNFNSSYIFFIEHGQEIEINAPINRNERNNSFKENAFVYNYSWKLLPDDFYLTKRSLNIFFNDFFDKSCSLLSLFFISNYSELRNEDIYFKINGYKSKSESFHLNDLVPNVNNIFNIYLWAYSERKCFDKLGIVRNILTINVDNAGQIAFNTEALNAIRSNYKIYLKDNVENYLKIKNSITEFVIDSASKIHILSESFLDSFRQNIFILLTFLVTVVLVNGLKDNGIEKIFSATYLFVIISLASISLMWMKFSKNDLVRKYNHLSQSILETLISNYKNLLIQSEIDDCIKPHLDNNKDFLYSQIKRYVKYWCWSITIFILFFIIGFVFLRYS